MPRHKIGVQVRQNHMLDIQFVFSGKFEVTIDVALRIDDGCRSRCLVTDKIGSMREAVQIKLLEDQATPPCLPPATPAVMFAAGYFSRLK
jgi:hypothetical protein